jgi:6-phosphogluconate dehydrogenase
MKLGFVGLGRMGGNMVSRLREGGHEVVAHDRSPEAVAAAADAGAVGVASLAQLAEALEPPRVVWVMVPAGEPTGSVLGELAALCSAGDLLVDGGNSRFHDSRRRAAELGDRGLRFCDVGVSGGVWGRELGFCMMLGGGGEDVARLRPVLDTLAPPEGWAHVGPAGAGHYVKMVHNGIEYGMLQAYGEGFEILAASEYELDLHQVAALWNRGSVVRSWLLELAERAFERDGRLERVRGYVEDSGEGRWTVAEAIDLDVPTPVLTLSLMARFASRQDESFAAKVIAALRSEFGGHRIVPE